jgi:transposase
VIALPQGARVWLAAGATDMRKGFDGLAALVQTQLAEDPFSGHLFVFRGRAGDRVKILWWDGDGLCLFAKRLERGRFVWPHAASGSVVLSSAQLAMLLEGIDWRHPVRTQQPELSAWKIWRLGRRAICAQQVIKQCARCFRCLAEKLTSLEREQGTTALRNREWLQDT